MTYTVAELAKLIEAEVYGNADIDIHGIAPIATAQTGQLTYLIGGKYRQYLEETKASVVLLVEDELAHCKATSLVVKNPEASFAKIATLFDLKKNRCAGVHASAVVGLHCKIDPSVSIGAHCVIGDNVIIEQDSVIMPGVVIGDAVIVGKNCIINSNVTIYHSCEIGDRVILHANATIGADGFGYTQEKGQWIKIPQIGRVLIENDVEIGANSCIDRGAIQDTILQQGVKIDNLVQVGHNVEIGAHTIIAGCSAIAGSATIGDHCMFGGSCNINGHISITSKVVLTGTTTVAQSIEEPGIYSSGFTAQPHRQWIKTVLQLFKLKGINKRLSKLESLYNDHND